MDGIEMLFGNKIGGARAYFAKDEANQTFRLILERDASVFSNREMNSLVDFYSETSDILWLSRNTWGKFEYRGGTGLAADGAKIKWEEAGNSALHTIYALGFGAGGIVGLAAPEPTSITKALAVVSFIKCGHETIIAASATQRFVRSINANARLANWVD